MTNSDPLSIRVPAGHTWHGQLRHLLLLAALLPGAWAIALLTRSQAALAAALFQHAYIWVHWYCTEQPDGVVLYGRSQDEGGVVRSDGNC
jgi:hypothetical protein